MLKRYLAFTSDYYYACGGWRDFAGSFDTLDEAKVLPVGFDRDGSWFHVVDSRTGQVVFEA